MTKADKIAEYIRRNNPRRKDIIIFLSSGCRDYSIKATKPLNKNLHGLYATNFTKWKRLGTVHVDPITKRYSLGKNFNGRLYTTKPKKGVTKPINVKQNTVKPTDWQKKYNKLLAEYQKLNEQHGEALDRLNKIWMLTKD